MILMPKPWINLIFFTNKNVKYLFYKYNGYLLFRNLPTVLVGNSIQKLLKTKLFERRHKIEIGNIWLSMKHNYKVARRVYGSIYTNIAEKFKIYIISLKRDEIDEIENDFRVNGNSLLSVRDTGSATELFNLFAMFYYINGRLPYTDGHLFVPNREIPLGIQGEK